MCNLYTVRKTASEVAAHFKIKKLPSDLNIQTDVYPGYPGMVVREEAGERILQAMTWGFPLRLATMAPTAKPKPVNNIADLNKPMWKGLARKPEWRCLIPVTAFAEAEGPKGAKTRTWLSLEDEPIFAWAGLWRQSDEWGAVYSGAMTDANAAITPVHNRMPVLLRPVDYDTWLHGSFDDIVALQQRTFPNEPILIERTDEPWVKRKEPDARAGAD